jgi:hypothetical protein
MDSEAVELEDLGEQPFGGRISALQLEHTRGVYEAMRSLLIATPKPGDCGKFR